MAAASGMAAQNPWRGRRRKAKGSKRMTRSAYCVYEKKARAMRLLNSAMALSRQQRIVAA